jgi:hypothetical protein
LWATDRFSRTPPLAQCGLFSPSLILTSILISVAVRQIISNLVARKIR